MPLIPILWLVGGSLGVGSIAGLVTGYNAHGAQDSIISTYAPWAVAGALLFVIIKKA